MTHFGRDLKRARSSSARSTSDSVGLLGPPENVDAEFAGAAPGEYRPLDFNLVREMPVCAPADSTSAARRVIEESRLRLF